jgi:hypothetical protein
MSQGIELVLIDIAVIMYGLGKLAAGSIENNNEQVNRHLKKHELKPVTDATLLRQVLQQNGYTFKEGENKEFLEKKTIELTVYDEKGKAWFALGREKNTDPYSAYILDTSFTQDPLPETARLSESDTMPGLVALVNAYSMVKASRVLEQEGWMIAEQRNTEGAVEVVARRRNLNTGEEYTLIMTASGDQSGMTVTTDSRRPDGTHGVCPNVDPLIKSIGGNVHKRWETPASRNARRMSGSGKLPSQLAKDQTVAQKKKNDEHKEQKSSQ